MHDLESLFLDVVNIDDGPVFVGCSINILLWGLVLQVFVEMWLHHYSLEVYQKLQSPQVKVGL